MTATQASKLNGINPGAEVNVDTNITVVENASDVAIQSSTGTNDVIEAATASAAGVMLPADRKKLDGLPGDADGVLNFEDLDDVTITSVANGQVPRWNGTNWVNTDVFANSTVLKFIGVVDAADNRSW